MDYNGFVDAIQQILNIPDDDSAFPNILPDMINYGELRIYREFDFLCTLASQTAVLVANNRNVALPSNVIVPQSLNVITPSTAGTPDAGTRNPMERVSVDWINWIYPSSTGATVPTKWALIGNPTIGSTIAAGPLNILLGPWPDATYTLEVIGTVRPTPISVANPTTFLSLNMPDLFIAACMIFGAGYQRDYGSQSDDPKLAVSWDAQYQALRAGVDIEELRKKSASVSWTPYIPTPTANSARERANGPTSA